MNTTLDKILNEEFIAGEGGILKLKEKIDGLDDNGPSDGYLQNNPMVQYLLMHFSDALIHVSTGFDDFDHDHAVYITGARFGLSDEVAVRLKSDRYKNQDQAKMISDRLGDIYAGMWGNGLGERFFDEVNFMSITEFLK